MDDLRPAAAEVPVGSDVFMRRILRELTGTLQHVAGMDSAGGYVSSVGAAMGRWIEAEYATVPVRPRAGRPDHPSRSYGPDPPASVVAAALSDIGSRIT